MLVNKLNFHDVISSINESSLISFDTETTGTNPYKNDSMFCGTISTDNNDFYFDYNSDYNEGTLSRLSIKDILKDFKGTIALHGAKFDMHFLGKEGLDLLKHDIHCTMAIGRVEKNDRMNYGLGALGKLVGMKKGDEVKAYANKHKLYDIELRDGKKTKKKLYHYEKIPLEIMQPYAEQDSAITLKLAQYQINSIEKQKEQIKGGVDAPSTKYDLSFIVNNEKKLTKTLFKMERVGIKIDVKKTEEFYELAKKEYRAHAADFESICGIPFKDSNKVLAEAFTHMGEVFPTTEKGNPSFRKDVLEGMETPLAKVVNDYRRSAKMANTYFASFLDYMDNDGVLHAVANQGGTTTGRMSYREPNLQNIPKRGEDKSPYPVRQCFVPRDGFDFFMLDFSQQEYRLMLDYAGEQTIIKLIMEEDLDVHTATALMVQIERDNAKTVNFALLYGVGNEQLGKMLGIGTLRAKMLRKKYFKKLPKVGIFTDKVKSKAERRRYIVSVYGRKLNCALKDFSYKMPNHLIQGGCGDIVKLAMNRIDDLLEEKNLSSRMLIQIHDEILMEIPKDERHIVPHIKEIMEKAYTPKTLPLTVGVDYSSKSWHDKEEYKI